MSSTHYKFAHTLNLSCCSVIYKMLNSRVNREFMSFNMAAKQMYKLMYISRYCKQVQYLWLMVVTLLSVG